MLDSDLAEIYGYSTKAFNQQVKNNIERFAEDFRFQLSKKEVEELRSKNLTAITGVNDAEFLRCVANDVSVKITLTRLSKLVTP